MTLNTSQAKASYAALLDQHVHVVPSFALECGRTLKDVPIAYKTWGKLNDTRDNVMIICHAFTGSADVEDWWGPLIGRGKAFDPSRWFIFCANVLGSPYGSASPLTPNHSFPTSLPPFVTESRPDPVPYGPEFPRTTIRDDVRIHKLVLDSLGVLRVGVVIGGSMGGMAVLEWPLCTPTGYVERIIPLATSARHSAWCISWGEAQRQSIYSDPAYDDGWYALTGAGNGRGPEAGLAAARMAALLTYRSRDSFESRFGRKSQVRVVKGSNGAEPKFKLPPTPGTPVEEHNDGHRHARPSTSSSFFTENDSGLPSPPPAPLFSAQSYLRYQGDKFTSRFDANCYIHITRKMDTHDITRGRTNADEDGDDAALLTVLAQLPPRPLVISIATDGLFTPSEQQLIAEGAPEAELVVIPSPDGHDGFLLEFERINTSILDYLRRELPQIYVGEPLNGGGEKEIGQEGFDVKKTSVFGEAEADVTMW